MITSQAIVAAGLDAKSLRARFDKPFAKIAPPEKRLIERWQSRAQSGRDRNLRDYKLYAAIDIAWDAGFRQTTQSIIGLIRDLNDSSGEEEALKTATQWGMTHLTKTVVSQKDGKPVSKTVLDLPVMYGVVLSLPRSMTLMRIARITTERLQVPFMKFEPDIQTDMNKLVCEIGNKRIEKGNRELG